MERSPEGVCNLYIDQASRDDAAWYTCTAFNAAGRTACRAKVQVIGKSKKELVRGVYCAILWCVHNVFIDQSSRADISAQLSMLLVG